jgi:hypothetical protein
MWRPMEVFLYDWWVIRKKRRSRPWQRCPSESNRPLTKLRKHGSGIGLRHLWAHQLANQKQDTSR